MSKQKEASVLSNWRELEQRSAVARSLADDACEKDDPATFEEAIKMTPEDKVEELFRHATWTAMDKSAISILKCLAAKGVDFSKEHRNTSIEVLEFLLTQGWDINAVDPYGNSKTPLMWWVVNDMDKLRWFLDHGASVHPRGQEPLSTDHKPMAHVSCPTILEEAVESGASIEAFELLRSKGAPLGWRPLHLAVECAAVGYVGPSEEEYREKHERSMAMVRHLIDVVGLDVNAPEQPPGTMILPRHRGGNVMCYIPDSGDREWGVRDITWLLLDRGADPTEALEFEGNPDCGTACPDFVADVKAWRELHSDESKDSNCTIQ